MLSNTPGPKTVTPERAAEASPIELDDEHLEKVQGGGRGSSFHWLDDACAGS